MRDGAARSSPPAPARPPSGGAAPIRCRRRRHHRGAPPGARRLAAAEPRTTAELAREAGVSAAVIRGMADAGLLIPAVLPFPRHSPFRIRSIPASPVAGPGCGGRFALRHAVAAREFSVTLLDGVTGSGKTEVYLEAMAEGLRAGPPGAGAAAGDRVVLAMAVAVRAALRRRTGGLALRPDVAGAPHHLARGGRGRGARRGGRPLRAVPAVPRSWAASWSTRSTRPRSSRRRASIYHARDMAVVRARFCSAPAVLVSATPSLETVANVEAGRYRASAPADAAWRRRAAAWSTAIDMRADPPERGHFLAPPLIAAVRDTMERGEQAMLFLNRRGYAPLTLCRRCGHRMQCPNCTAWLVEHRARRELRCHHCGHTMPIPDECPACGAAHSLVAGRSGRGAHHRRGQRAVSRDARRLVMASDTMPGPHAAAEAARAIEAREVDLIIGTQIVAKGWHFPHLTLVGVVDADLGLAGGDLRAAERTVQLLHQVAGRAGRAEAPGRVLLQTFSPEHPVMQALVDGDLAAFMASEAAQRPARALAALWAAGGADRQRGYGGGGRCAGA